MTTKTAENALLTKVTLEFSDGKVIEIEGEDAARWQSDANRQAILAHLHGMGIKQPYNWKTVREATPKPVVADESRPVAEEDVPFVLSEGEIVVMEYDNGPMSGSGTYIIRSEEDYEKRPTVNVRADYYIAKHD